MATTVNRVERGDDGASWGPTIVAIIVILAAIAFVVWGIPMMQGTNNAPSVPAAPQVDVDVGGVGGGETGTY